MSNPSSTTPVESYLLKLDKQESVKRGFHEIRDLDPSITLMALAAGAAKIAAVSAGIATGAVVGHHVGKKMIGAGDNKGGNLLDQADKRLIARLRSTDPIPETTSDSKLLSSSDEPSVEDLFQLRHAILQ